MTDRSNELSTDSKIPLALFFLQRNGRLRHCVIMKWNKKSMARGAFTYIKLTFALILLLGGAQGMALASYCLQRSGQSSCCSPKAPIATVAAPKSSSCKMACCHQKAAPKAAEESQCHSTVESKNPSDNCKCHLSPAQPNELFNTTVSSFDAKFTVLKVATLAKQVWQDPVLVLRTSEPGIFGVDSGPPGGVKASPHQGRAPPVFLA